MKPPLLPPHTGIDTSFHECIQPIFKYYILWPLARVVPKNFRIPLHKYPVGATTLTPPTSQQQQRVMDAAAPNATGGGAEQQIPNPPEGGIPTEDGIGRGADSI